MALPPIIQTKCTIPPTKTGFVVRSRLTELLDRALDVPLTLVSAPAGFGKTSLVSHWVRNCGVPACWLTLDEGDDTVGYFLRYVVAALETVDGLSVGVAGDELGGPEVVETARARIINSLSELESDVVFVLDDYHLVSEAGVHGTVAFFLERLPS